MGRARGSVHDGVGLKVTGSNAGRKATGGGGLAPHDHASTAAQELWMFIVHAAHLKQRGPWVKSELSTHVRRLKGKAALGVAHCEPQLESSRTQNQSYGLLL
jgi:hypothetical protein